MPANALSGINALAEEGQYGVNRNQVCGGVLVHTFLYPLVGLPALVRASLYP